MLKRTEAAKTREVFAEPTPLGLIGLAIGCAALTPIAFGFRLTPMGLKTAAMFCLLFGAGCQFLAGMMNFANRNLYGGTLLTAFSFTWVANWWALDTLAKGAVPDHGIILATEVLSLVLFIVFTYGFGFYSKLLFYFLLDIDLLYACKVLNAVTGTHWFNIPIAVCTVALGLLALWIAFALLINPTAGRPIFKVAGPMFSAPRKPGLDLSAREIIAETLYAHWRERSFEPMPYVDLARTVEQRAGRRNIVPDLLYMKEVGGLALTHEDGEISGVRAVRLTASGIDAYETFVLGDHA